MAVSPTSFATPASTPVNIKVDPDGPFQGFWVAGDFVAIDDVEFRFIEDANGNPLEHGSEQGGGGYTLKVKVYANEMDTVLKAPSTSRCAPERLQPVGCVAPAFEIDMPASDIRVLGG